VLCQALLLRSSMCAAQVCCLAYQHTHAHMQGALRVSRFNPFEGWVGSEAVGADILITGRLDMNRAMDGEAGWTVCHSVCRLSGMLMRGVCSTSACL
jgi:hypothetical protein